MFFTVMAGQANRYERFLLCPSLLLCTRSVITLISCTNGWFLFCRKYYFCHGQLIRVKKFAMYYQLTEERTTQPEGYVTFKLQERINRVRKSVF